MNLRNVYLDHICHMLARRIQADVAWYEQEGVKRGTWYFFRFQEQVVWAIRKSVISHDLLVFGGMRLRELAEERVSRGWQRIVVPYIPQFYADDHKLTTLCVARGTQVVREPGCWVMWHDGKCVDEVPDSLLSASGSN